MTTPSSNIMSNSETKQWNPCLTFPRELYIFFSDINMDCIYRILVSPKLQRYLRMNSLAAGLPLPWPSNSAFSITIFLMRFISSFSLEFSISNSCSCIKTTMKLSITDTRDYKPSQAQHLCCQGVLQLLQAVQKPTLHQQGQHYANCLFSVKSVSSVLHVWYICNMCVEF